jgi:hypothetical protein
MLFSEKRRNCMPDQTNGTTDASGQDSRGQDDNGDCKPERKSSRNILSIVPGSRSGIDESGHPVFPEKPFLLKGDIWFFHLEKKGSPKEQVSWAYNADWVDIFRIAGPAALTSCCDWTLNHYVAQHFARMAVPEFGPGREVHAELDGLVGLDLIRHLFALELIEGRKKWSLTPTGRGYLRLITLRDLGRL